MTVYQLTEETAWCPGCGNPMIRRAVQQALNELGLPPEQVVMVAGIGQAAKMPQYIEMNSFTGLHGRSLPAAIGIKLANTELTVIAQSGDGDNYGEGGNHFISAIRRNINIAHFVHDNQVYGLTKGQASPTTAQGQITSVQSGGVKAMPFHPLAMALVTGAGFVARGFSGDHEQLVTIMKAALQFKGYALVDILQPCVVWNKINTFQWYKKRVQPLDDNHDTSNWDFAFAAARQWGEVIPTGILYQVEKPTYDEQYGFITGSAPLAARELAPQQAEPLLQRFY